MSPGTVWAPEGWNGPLPHAMTGDPERRPALGDMRMVTPWNTSDQAGRVWLRETHPLVDGEVLSPFIRTALAADFANPMANSGDQGLGYINADLTLNVVREAEGEWIGCEVVGHVSADGIAVGVISLHDVVGRVGYATVQRARRQSPVARLDLASPTGRLEPGCFAHRNETWWNWRS